MAIQFEDVISALCTESSQSHANDFQRVFALSTPLEAKLVFEVLVACGFDVKVYHQAGQPSKLYISNPTMPAGKLEHQLAAALVYARALKQIKVNIDHLCSGNEALISSMDYNIAFVNTQPNGKQILIQMIPGNSGDTAAQPGEQPEAASAAAPQAAAAAAAAPAQPRYKYGEKPKGHYEELSSGPAVGRGNYPGKLSIEGEAQQNSLKRRIMLYLFGNAATSSFALFLMIVFLGIIFSVLVFARAIVCPDFAVANQNKAWYCKIGKEDENEKQKQKQQQQQQQSQPLLQQPTPVAPR